MQNTRGMNDHIGEILNEIISNVSLVGAPPRTTFTNVMDNLHHQPYIALQFVAIDIPEIRLLWRDGTSFRCRKVYIHDTRQRNGIPVSRVGCTAVQQALVSLEQNSELYSRNLLIFPNGDRVGGTCRIHANGLTCSFYVKREGQSHHFLLVKIY